MTTSGAAAIHALVLVATNKSSSVVDLDVLAIWPMLTIGAVTVVPMLMWSPTVRGTRGIPVLVWWGILNWVGTVALVLSISLLGPASGEAICYSNRNETLLNQEQLRYQPERFNCTYSCFARPSLVRSPSETIIFERFLPTGFSSDLLKYDGPFIFVGTLVFCQIFQMLYAWLVLAGRPIREEWDAALANVRNLHHDGLDTAKARGYLVLCAVMVVLSLANFPVFVIIIVMSECYLAQAGYPQSEGHMNVGQWTPFVALALALCALAMTKTHGHEEAQGVGNSLHSTHDRTTQPDYQTVSNRRSWP